MTTAPKDQQQRQGAIDPKFNVHIEAPAGSGKTTVLMKRFLTLLAQVDKPEEVLALTFTRKAAGELRTRIQEEFSARTDKNQFKETNQHQAELQELAQTAFFRHVDQCGISLLERLQISTFHGFCARLIKSSPHVIGLPPDFTLMEDAKRIQKEAVELMRRQLTALPAADPARQALVQRLVRLNNNWPRLASELQNLLSRRDILTEFIVLARQSRDPAAYEAVLRQHLHSLIGPQLLHLSQDFRASALGRQWPEFYRYLSDCGSDLADALPDNIPGSKLEDAPAWKALGEALLTTNGGCYKSFNKKFPKNIKDSPWCHLLRDLPDSLVRHLNQFRTMSSCLLQQDEVDALQDLIILLNRTLTQYEQLCRSRRVLDFIELEQQTLNLLELRGVQDVFNYIDSRLMHLLVDEFQDTSGNQIRLICQLVSDWQCDSHRSLMVVGDPKQSIYGWRQARVEEFVRSREEKKLSCPRSPIFETITLHTNFRSYANLIHWTNQIFGDTIMCNKDKCGVEFHAAEPMPGAIGGSPPQLALFNYPDKKKAREREATWLAAEVSRLQKNLAPQQKIGVLIFVRTHLPVYLKAFREAKLNPTVKDGLPLRDSFAVQHLHNLSKALVRPHDDLAWAALIRGFAGPQPLSLLAAISTAPGKFWSEKIAAFSVSAACPPELIKFYQAVAKFKKMVGRNPFHEVLADLSRKAGIWSKAGAWEGPQGVANIKSYLDIVAGTAVETPETTLSQIEDALAEAYQPPDPLAQDSPVEILTVHKSKGLEYDHVFVPHLDWGPLQTSKDDAPFLLEEMTGSESAVIALKRAFLQTEESMLYQALKLKRKNSILAEARRLFYVAVTRAKKSLHLSGVISQNKKGEWKFNDNSPLSWLRQHYAEGELCSGADNQWEDPPLPVRLFSEDSELSCWREAYRQLKSSETEGAAEKVFSNVIQLFPGNQEPASGGSSGSILPEPYDIQPERRPYQVKFPSQLCSETGGEAGEDDFYAPECSLSSLISPGRESQSEGLDINLVNRLRGEISHRLLDTLAKGGGLPGAAAMAPALSAAVASPEAALALAGEILAEIIDCQEDPFLAPLLSRDLPVARSEWLLESWHGDDTVYRGQIDRLAYDGRHWWLLDYKTSRPEASVSWQDFIVAQVKKYRPQLLAYREMAARFYQIEPPESIKTVLYFTASQRHVII